jgi:hypothetical protein
VSKMYRQLSVWKRIDDKSAVRFRCLEAMDSHLFGIQSADFHTLPLKAEVVANSDRQFVELLVEIEPAERCSWYTSLVDAIAAHEESFRSMAENVTARERE